MLKDIIKKRALKHGRLFLERNATIRSVAQKSGVSKSTVHLDINRLKDISPELFKKIQEKININLKERHIRGGEATKKKYKG